MPYKPSQHDHGGNAAPARLGEALQAQEPVEDVGYGCFCSSKVDALGNFASWVRVLAVTAAELGCEVVITSLNLKRVVNSTGYVTKKLNGRAFLRVLKARKRVPVRCQRCPNDNSR